MTLTSPSKPYLIIESAEQYGHNLKSSLQRIPEAPPSISNALSLIQATLAKPARLSCACGERLVALASCVALSRRFDRKIPPSELDGAVKMLKSSDHATHTANVLFDTTPTTLYAAIGSATAQNTIDNTHPALDYVQSCFEVITSTVVFKDNASQPSLPAAGNEIKYQPINQSSKFFKFGQLIEAHLSLGHPQPLLSKESTSLRHEIVSWTTSEALVYEKIGRLGFSWLCSGAVDSFQRNHPLVKEKDLTNFLQLSEHNHTLSAFATLSDFNLDSLEPRPRLEDLHSDQIKTLLSKLFLRHLGVLIYFQHLHALQQWAQQHLPSLILRGIQELKDPNFSAAQRYTPSFGSGLAAPSTTASTNANGSLEATVPPAVKPSITHAPLCGRGIGEIAKRDDNPVLFARDYADVEPQEPADPTEGTESLHPRSESEVLALSLTEPIKPSPTSHVQSTFVEESDPSEVGVPALSSPPSSSILPPSPSPSTATHMPTSQAFNASTPVSSLAPSDPNASISPRSTPSIWKQPPTIIRPPAQLLGRDSAPSPSSGLTENDSFHIWKQPPTIIRPPLRPPGQGSASSPLPLDPLEYSSPGNADDEDSQASSLESSDERKNNSLRTLVSGDELAKPPHRETEEGAESVSCFKANGLDEGVEEEEPNVADLASFLASLDNPAPALETKRGYDKSRSFYFHKEEHQPSSDCEDADDEASVADDDKLSVASESEISDSSSTPSSSHTVTAGPSMGQMLVLVRNNTPTSDAEAGLSDESWSWAEPGREVEGSGEEETDGIASTLPTSADPPYVDAPVDLSRVLSTSGKRKRGTNSFGRPGGAVKRDTLVLVSTENLEFHPQGEQDDVEDDEGFPVTKVDHEPGGGVDDETAYAGETFTAKADTSPPIQDESLLVS